MAGWRVAVHAVFSLVYLTLIVTSIPLAFDVGGEDCGIAFTLTLTQFYFVLSTVRIICRNTKLSFVGSLLYYCQNIIIPSLLIVHLSYGSEQPESYWLVLKPYWQAALKNSTFIFTMLEGFCSVLVIQTTGKYMRTLIRRSDSWMFVQIVVSSIVLTMTLLLLRRIYSLPMVIDLASASLIGAALTASVLLALYGIVSGRGSPIESSLLFAYVIYCLYLTFTDFESSPESSGSFLSMLWDPIFKASSSTSSPMSTPPVTPFSAAASTAANSNLFGLGLPRVLGGRGLFPSEPTHAVPVPQVNANIPPLPPIIITGFTNFVTTVAELIPQGFKTIFDFLRGAMSSVSPSVVVSLAYRLTVFYAAALIIPSIQSSSPRSRPRRIMFRLLTYSPCVIIALYTHLLMHHFGILAAKPFDSSPGVVGWIDRAIRDPQLSWQVWGWANIFGTLTVYCLELVYGKESSGDALVDGHFKQE